MQHSSLLGQFISYKENEVLSIGQQESIYLLSIVTIDKRGTLVRVIVEHFQTLFLIFLKKYES
jgi:hypothetical protein